MTKDIKYWNDFYKKNSVTTEPSPFARFISDLKLEDCGDIVDVGCGNGRDTLFFTELGFNCIGVDNSEVDCLNKAGVSFIKDNFCNMHYDSLSNNYSIYSRFT